MMPGGGGRTGRVSFLSSWIVAVSVPVFLWAGTAFPVTESQREKAPEFAAVDLDGRTIALGEALKRHRGVVLNFWGVRCQACIEEIPHLNVLSEKYSGTILFLGINVDGIVSDKIKSQVGGAGLDFRYPVLPDPDFALAEKYKMMGAPWTVLIGDDGGIRYQHEGYEAGDEVRIEEEIRQMLDAPSPR